MTNMTGSKLSIFSHPGKITGYWINMGLDFVSGQYGCLFSRLRLGSIWGTRDDNQANMEMPMY